MRFLIERDRHVLLRPVPDPMGSPASDARGRLTPGGVLTFLDPRERIRNRTRGLGVPSKSHYAEIEQLSRRAAEELSTSIGWLKPRRDCDLRALTSRPAGRQEVRGRRSEVIFAVRARGPGASAFGAGLQTEEFLLARLELELEATGFFLARLELHSQASGFLLASQQVAERGPKGRRPLRRGTKRRWSKWMLRTWRPRCRRCAVG